MLLHEFILNSPFQQSDKICMELEENGHWYRLTYSEFKQQINDYATKLSGYGVKPGQRVILLSTNKPVTMIVYFAILVCKATPVFLDPNLANAELTKLITFVESNLLLIDSFLLSEIKLESLPNLEIRTLQNFDICKKGRELHLKAAHEDLEVAGILFTSGTTGFHKGVMLTHTNFIESIKQSKIVIDLSATDRMLTILPIHHISPLLQNLVSLYAGSSLIFVNKLEGSVILGTMQAAKPTIIGVVPAVLNAFLDKIENEIKKTKPHIRAILKIFALCSQSFDKLLGINAGFYLFKKIQKAFGGHLTRIICGGAAANPAVVNKLHTFGFRILEAYGLTEVTGPICSNRIKKIRIGTVGQPFDGIAIKVNKLLGNDSGEICVKGPVVMKGYFKDESATNNALKDQWFLTGDTGYFNKKGLLVISGRIKETIVLKSGKKINPADVEEYYQSIPGVAELTVFGMHINQYEEQVHAAVVLKEELIAKIKNHEATIENIQRQIEEKIYECGSKLAQPLQIQRIHVLEQLPKTAMGKVKRTLLPNLISEKSQNTVVASPPSSISTPAESQLDKPTTSTMQINDLEAWVTRWMANRLSISQASIQKQQSFIYYGLGSLDAIELCTDLQNWLSIVVNPAAIWEHHTPEKLSLYLYKKLTLVPQTDENSVVTQNQETDVDDKIAIIGMACHFPGEVNDPESFWSMLCNGQSGISQTPANRWNNNEFYDANADIPGKINTKWGGFIDGMNHFDANFFEISPNEAINIDPQHRLLLELSWQALERAAIAPSSLAGSETGVYVAIGTNDYAALQADRSNVKNISAYYGVGNSFSAASGRIAYFYGLHGICKSVDTACSSSLVAIHDACQDLLKGETNLAIVGAANALLSPVVSISLSKAKMLAPDGRCKVFDADADGYVRGEGCAVVILKRLKDATANNDPILGVIVGSGVNQDGHSNGLTAPNVEAQEKLFRKTLKNAKLMPNQISYIETHGTGTPLGDPIEVRSINKVFSENRSPNKPLYIGAVKSNIGHLEAAAGMAGLIKVLLMLQSKKIPQQINFHKLNPWIEAGQIDIPRQLLPWQQEHRPLYAAVNSFGFTGTNAQIILSESPNSLPAEPSEKPYYLIALSAKTENSLRQRLLDLDLWLQTNLPVSLSSLSYTLNKGRDHFKKRCAFVVNTFSDLQQQIQNYLAQNTEQNPKISERIANSENIISELSTLGLSPNKYFDLLTDLATLYVMGHSFNWDDLYKDEPQQKIILPTYPFAKQSYWIDVAITEASSKQSLLGFQVLPSARGLIFKNKIQALGQYHYLKDHKIFGLPIFPGSGYVELLLSAGQHIFNQASFSLQNVIFERVLGLNESSPTTIQLEAILDADHTDAYQLTIHSIMDHAAQPSWQQHASCKLIANQENQSLVCHDLAALKTNKQQIAIPDAYRTLDKAGFNYGPDFRAVKQLWVNETEAFAELKTSLTTSKYTCHPALMDGCFQLVGMMLLEKIEHLTDEIFLPSSVTSVVINQPLGHKFFVLVQLQSVTNTQVLADFELIDSSGKCIGKITGFNLRAVDKKYLLRFDRDINAFNHLFYQLTWQQSNEVPQTVANQTKAEGTWFILGNESDLLVKELTTQLQQQGETAQAFNSHTLDPCMTALKQHSIKGIIVLNDSQHDEQEHCKTLLHIIQKLAALQQAIKLWVVTRGACSVQGEVPTGFNTATLWGMGKALNLEQRQIKCTLVDLDPLMSIEASTKAFINELSHQAEEQIALRLTGRWVARLMNNEKGATDLALPPPQENYQLCPSDSHLIEDLKFVSLPKQAPKANEVVIEVKAAALNFRDTLNALGLYPDKNVPLGVDCAGIVVEVGSNVKKLQIGDAVLGLVPGCFANRITTDAANVVLKPKNLSFSEAATIPAVFLTAYYALHEIVPTLKNKRILIHTASGGLGLAAIQIAKLAGAEIFATAGSEEKRAYLRSLNITHVFDSRNLNFGPAIQAATDQRGVDIVLNTLTGKDFIPTTLSACAKDAYFIELSKRDIWTAEQVAAIRPDIHYEILAVDALADKNRLQNIFNTLLPLFESGQLQPLIFRSYSFARAVSAFQAMRQAKHVGKLMLVSETRWEKQTAADGIHVITGGLGGLGLAVTEWMLAHGAEHILLVNRSAVIDDNTVLASLKSQYPEANIETYQADISDRSQVQRLITHIQTKSQPLRGIVHAAGVLQDAMLVNQTWEKYELVFAPKITGAWNLHQFTQNMNLDYFVLFSSAASLLGSPGQSNHAAANAYLDALAHYRRSQGMAATSINWGAWAEIGCAANVNTLFESYGLRWLTPADGVAAFGEIMNKANEAQIGVMPIEWHSYFQWLGSKPRWLSQVGNEQTKSTKKAKLGLKEILAKSSPEHYEMIIKDYIKDTLRQILKLDQNYVFDEQKALGELGMDSLMAMEFGSYLQKHIENNNFPETFIFNNASIHTLSMEILRLINGAPHKVPEVKLKESDLEIIDKHINAIIKPKFSLRFTQKFIRPTLFALSKKYFQVEIKGKELLPQQEPYILCANHLSSLDGLALLLAVESQKNNFVILLADNHFYKSKSIFAIGDAVPFDRARNDYTLQKNIAYLKRLKEQNKCFILFPEGTRSEDGSMKEFKNGVAWFAHKVGLKVVPAYIEGTYQLLPKSARFPKPGKLKVAIGKSLGFDADSPGEFAEFNMSRYEEFTTKLKNEILNLKKLFQMENI